MGDDANLLQQLHELLCANPDLGARNFGSARRFESARPVDEFKVTELPECEGNTDPENVSLWFENLKTKRARDGKEKLKSWDALKRKLRKRYVSRSHKIDIYRKIAELSQGSLSIVDYIAEFEKLSLMSEMDELEEQKIARFCRGLNKNIAFTVDLQSYDSFDMLCQLCSKVERQNKVSRSSTSFTPKSNAWSKPEGARSGGSVSTVVTPAPTPKPLICDKPESSSKEKDLAKVRCFKCQGFGHFRSDCPNKRIVTLRKAMNSRDELSYDLAVEEKGLFVLNEDEEAENEELSYEAPTYDTLVLRRMLHSKVETVVVEQRDHIFHTKCQVGDKWCSVIVDGGSCTNVVPTELIEKPALVTTPHLKPYTLHLLDDGSKVKVSKRARVNFTMGPYKDAVLCDVIPMDACHLLLGRPWGKKPSLTMFANEREIEQELDDGGCVYALIALNQPQPQVSEHDAINELLLEFADVFPDDLPTGLPPIRGIEHQIDLISGAPLPNKAAYRSNSEE
ncbi:uncharacterized protein LOC141639006 [Silene latifolia]|uniref:uncharacterized protein LOC141639006 n=1 Tax=Silene latifolia TaxID=37657 RepID=UPI003D77B674